MVISLHLGKLRMQMKHLPQTDLLLNYLQMVPVPTRHQQTDRTQTLVLQTGPLPIIPRQLNLLQKPLPAKKMHWRAVLPAELP
jgi:hypothetical protein